MATTYGKCGQTGQDLRTCTCAVHAGVRRIIAEREREFVRQYLARPFFHEEARPDADGGSVI